MSDAGKSQKQERVTSGHVQVIVAISALGLGVDIPDISYNIWMSR